MIRAALLVFLVGSAHAQPDTTKPKVPAKPALSAPMRMLAEVEANYQKPQHLAATFDQTVTNSITGQAAPANGTFLVEKPDKLKFDFMQPKRTPPKLKVTYLLDGKTFWMIDHHNKQYGEKAVAGSDLPSMMTFFLGAGTLARDFNVELATDPALVTAGATALLLTPKKPSASYAKIVLELDDKRMVTRTTIVNSSGNKQAMKFTSVVLDKAAPAGTFKLDPRSIAGYGRVKP